MKLQNIALCAVLTLGLGLAACEKKPETPLQNLEDKVKDGLDSRPNEKLKDAAEDIEKAADSTGEAMKEAVTPDPK